MAARTDVEAAQGECGIMTTLINKFSAENPDVRIRVSPVAWPGYNQLAAQLAAGDPPDLVTMHLSAIPDYQSRKLIEPHRPTATRRWRRSGGLHGRQPGGRQHAR